MKRSASAAWRGGLKEVKEAVSTQSGVLNTTPYGFNTRFENGPGTNPEELKEFAEIARQAKAECPVAKLLKAEISLLANLDASVA